MSEQALAHCRRVAETSALLGTIYGVDPELCRIAGLLHDWDREIPKHDLPERARAMGLSVDEGELAAPYLLHARTAAIELSLQFPGLPADIIRAVENHTVGSEQMSELDMVVFVADMIEPGRAFAGVDELREYAGTLSLNELFAACYQKSVAHLVSVRKFIHPQTVGVWNRYVARRSE